MGWCHLSHIQAPLTGLTPQSLCPTPGQSQVRWHQALPKISLALVTANFIELNIGRGNLYSPLPRIIGNKEDQERNLSRIPPATQPGYPIHLHKNLSRKFLIRTRGTGTEKEFISFRLKRYYTNLLKVKRLDCDCEDEVWPRGGGERNERRDRRWELISGSDGEITINSLRAGAVKIKRKYKHKWLDISSASSYINLCA